MPVRNSKNTFTIKNRFRLIAGAAAVAIGVITATAVITSNMVAGAVEEQSRVENVNAKLSEMSIAGRELLLAAMDSIIDQQEGEIQPERVVIIDQSLVVLRKGREFVMKNATSE